MKKRKENPMDLFSLPIHELCDFTVKREMSQGGSDTASP